MADFWGPALDAELAYRHERLFTALRGVPVDDGRDGPGTSERTADTPAASSVTDGSLSAARGWLLRGSETWHAAR